MTRPLSAAEAARLLALLDQKIRDLDRLIDAGNFRERAYCQGAVEAFRNVVTMMRRNEVAP